MCEWDSGRVVYARILIEMLAKDPREKERKIKAFMDNGATSTSLRVERTRAIPFTKKKVQVDNCKGKGVGLKITQVYERIIHDLKKKNVSTNMLDSLLHQRVDDTEDDSSIPLSSTLEISSQLPTHNRAPLTVAISLLQLISVDDFRS
ncbi:unnamed protein product [Lactuca virosa]|uniref:Uncharacterized protein n=1 Tax=Lactuca virosa TaxID=75947 RepID=A0AAU9NMS1_9ASTR|nr:unnamed protein product [Lactuca virosa]